MFYSNSLKKFRKINHCFFSKKGGHSKGIYRSLNCGIGSKDSRKMVLKNLATVKKKMKIKKLVLMYQTHSNRVIVINKNNKNLKKFNSDAIITKMKNFTLGVVTADCVPIILYDVKNKVIGCVHAGWKGALSGIIEKTITAFKKLNYDCKILASVGPCIGKKNYEVDFDFYQKFLLISKKNSVYFTKKNKTKKLFDLRKFVGDKLVKQKVKVDHVNHDTFAEKNKFFSYRRSKKLCENDYGRCISVISLI